MHAAQMVGDTDDSSASTPHTAEAASARALDHAGHQVSLAERIAARTARSGGAVGRTSNTALGSEVEPAALPAPAAAYASELPARDAAASAGHEDTPLLAAEEQGREGQGMVDAHDLDESSASADDAAVQTAAAPGPVDASAYLRHMRSQGRIADPADDEELLAAEEEYADDAAASAPVDASAYLRHMRSQGSIADPDSDNDDEDFLAVEEEGANDEVASEPVDASAFLHILRSQGSIANPEDDEEQLLTAQEEAQEVDDAARRVRSAALSLLSHRLYTAAGLAEKLVAKGHEREAAEAVIADLQVRFRSDGALAMRCACAHDADSWMRCVPRCNGGRCG